MAVNLYDAHTQWLNRPADERYSSVDDLYKAVSLRKSRSVQTIAAINGLRVESSNSALMLNGAKPPIYFTHSGFSQLCSRIGAPASYLRSLAPSLAKECLQYGLQISAERCNMLIRVESSSQGSAFEKYAAAFTGPAYGRIWDADVIENLVHGVQNTSWHVPPARSAHGSVNSGLYASDHDMFAFMVNDEKPVEIGNAKLGKGFFCWNSETGTSTFGLTTFLYNYVCGNHIVWDVDEVKQLTIYHRSHALQKFYSAAMPALETFLENKVAAESVKDTIGRSMSYRIAPNLEKTLDWFGSRPFTRREISSAWESGLSQGEDVTTLWGMIQGLTAVARDYPFADKRVDLERRAGSLLKVA